MRIFEYFYTWVSSIAGRKSTKFLVNTILGLLPLLPLLFSMSFFLMPSWVMLHPEWIPYYGLIPFLLWGLGFIIYGTHLLKNGMISRGEKIFWGLAFVFFNPPSFISYWYLYMLVGKKILTDRIRFALGAATFFPLLYLLIFISLGIWEELRPLLDLLLFFSISFPIVLLVITFLIAIYIILVFQNEHFSTGKKIGWAVGILAFSLLSMPIYWYWRVYRQKS